MPGIFTHFLCGDVVLRQLNDTPAAKLLEKHRQAFNLGTQGPDILFYHGAWPWAKDEGMNKIGDQLHEHGSGIFFRQALHYIDNFEGEKRDILTAYLCGFTCHYCLDLHAHPYIFYSTGFVRPGEAETKKYEYYHREFETTLDVLMLKRQQDIAPADFHAADLIAVSAGEADSISKMYETVLPVSLGIEIDARQLSKAISDMVGITRVLHDRTGLKKKLLAAVEKRLGKYPLLSSMIHPLSVTDDLDYLNLKHGEWCLPWDDSTCFNTSLIDMFDAAVAEACTLCTAVYDCSRHGMAVDDAVLLLGNRSFSSGIDCEENAEFKYYNCIYE